MSCEHKRISNMTWPDGGDSELCRDCLMTRYHWEWDSTEWQNHGYKTPKDWYQEAADLQHQIDIL